MRGEVGGNHRRIEPLVDFERLKKSGKPGRIILRLAQESDGRGVGFVLVFAAVRELEMEIGAHAEGERGRVPTAQQQRRNRGEIEREDLIAVLEKMVVGDVAEFVGEHAGQFLVIRKFGEQTREDEDVTSRDHERVGLGLVDDEEMNRVDVFAQCTDESRARGLHRSRHVRIQDKPERLSRFREKRATIRLGRRWFVGFGRRRLTRRGGATRKHGRGDQRRRDAPPAPSGPGDMTKHPISVTKTDGLR